MSSFRRATSDISASSAANIAAEGGRDKGRRVKVNSYHGTDDYGTEGGTGAVLGGAPAGAKGGKEIGKPILKSALSSSFKKNNNNNNNTASGTGTSQPPPTPPLSGTNGVINRRVLKSSVSSSFSSTLDFFRPSPGRALKRQEMSSSVPAADAAPTTTEKKRRKVNYDTRLLQRAVEDAGRWAFGTVLVEVWVLSEDRTCLIRPEGGWWIDPSMHEGCKGRSEFDEDNDNDCLICRLTDENHVNYEPPRPMAPGQGLPGLLWSEASATKVWTKTFRHSVAQRLTTSNRLDNNKGLDSTMDLLTTLHAAHKKVAWRDVQQLDKDPDQPWNPRLSLLAQLGLGWAASVPFRFREVEGIVIYMAREHVDMGRLQAETNQSYIIAASDFIGSAYALRGPRKTVIKDRRTELSKALQKVRRGISAMRAMGGTFDDLINNKSFRKEKPETPEQPTQQNCLCCVEVAHGGKKFAFKNLKKAKGTGAQAPPSFTWRQSFFTFFGVLTTLLVVTNFTESMADMYGPEYRSLLGPMGALMTLLYGLTAAPATQPRNAICGQVLSMMIATAFSYATSLPTWLRQSLATSFSVFGMVKLNITHPPAGAAAMIFSAKTPPWGCLVGMILINILAIVTATFVNNLSDKRQYPNYWGLAPLVPAWKKIKITTSEILERHKKAATDRKKIRDEQNAILIKKSKADSATNIKKVWNKDRSNTKQKYDEYENEHVIVFRKEEDGTDPEKLDGEINDSPI